MESCSTDAELQSLTEIVFISIALVVCFPCTISLLVAWSVKFDFRAKLKVLLVILCNIFKPDHLLAILEVIMCFTLPHESELSISANEQIFSAVSGVW